MQKLTQFYIDGEWRTPHGKESIDVINPATEDAFAELAMGDSSDVDAAVNAARNAFPAFSETSREERLGFLSSIAENYTARMADIGAAITTEMGAPVKLANSAQAAMGSVHLSTMIDILQHYPFEEEKDGYDLVKEPVGVVGLITPWNWPVNQIMCKLAPAIAAGCTVVLKPSEIAPASAQILAEIIDASTLPKGVFNMVHGTGPEVGAAISAHPGIDMVSFTGSTRAGVEVAKAAAPTVKRVAQELGGKSANIILDGDHFEKAVAHGVKGVMTNTGQSCNAPTRMLVPAARLEEATKIAKATAEKIIVGDPTSSDTAMGPLSNINQWNKVRSYIEQGVAEGATLASGGAERPAGQEKGYFVQPTVFSNVSNDMTIAREEIFGPVVSIIPYKDENDAVAIANDTPYGLSAYVYGADVEAARKIGKRLRAGNVHLNGAHPNPKAPFGGYKQSGNGREWGELGLEDFLEVKAMMKP